jgi:prevent-host-death family protein
MTEIGAFEAKNKLSALLDLVERSQGITITRRGKPVARQVAVKDSEPKKKMTPEEAAEGIRKLREGLTLGGISLKELINEGRK